MLSMLLATPAKDVTMTDMMNGYSRAETSAFSVEVPNGWTVSEKTDFGSRDITSDGSTAKFNIMELGVKKDPWDDLYATSVEMAKKEVADGSFTPYEKFTTKGRYEAIKFGAKDSNDFMTHRWTLVRNGSGDLVAIGVTIPNGDSEKKLSKDFQHMIDTLVVKHPM
ncbi:MAG: hypothetical protein JST40_03070 [Armatimonadetes bacterium]|nr:hypothetical protein [Armatimonadota bacterium]